MDKIGIFFGSDTGNTENIAKSIQKILGDDIAQLYDIANSNQQDVESFNILIFGTPTWYYGEAQCDWEDFFPTLRKINFNNKFVALFGCGDQEDYAEYFCDAIAIIHNIIEPRGAKIIGYWSTKGYDFVSSKSLVNDKYFMGLTIDEDRQPELTQQRVATWVKKILNELN